MIALLVCTDLFAQTNGSVSAHSLILTDGQGRKVTIIPQRDAAIGDYVFEVPLVPISPSTGEHGFGKQLQQVPNDNNPYITFSAGPTTLTDNRILAAGTGISLTNAGSDNGNMTIANSGVLSLAGTANQVSVSSSTGNVTLSLPQNIHSSASPTFSNLTLSSMSSSSSSANIVVSNSGALQTRTIASLGKSDGSEPVLTFSSDGGTLTNNRVVTAGSGIGLTTGGSDGSNFTIANTGVLSATAGTGIGLSGSTGNVTISNNGLLSASAGSGISVGTAAGNATITNTGVLSALAGTGIGLSGSTGTVTISNNGLLSASAGSGVSVSTVAGNATITNTGVLSNIAGSGISVSSASGNVTITNNGLLAATAGTGITVSTAAGNATIANTGVLSLTAGTGIALTNSTGNITVSNTGVTSVGLSMPGIFAVANSPVTTTGTLAVSLVDQAPNTFLAGPVSGSDAAPSFRALDFADFDALVWTLQGNNVATGAYIGTTNSEPFDMRVNGTTRLLLTDRVTVQRDDAALRGFYATDMQASRTSSNQVASGNYSTISGGRANRASGIGSTVGGGGYDGDVVSGNSALGRATTVAGGHGNEASIDLASVGGGDYNTAGGYVTTVAGGQFNIAGDYGATVAGGISNVASVELSFIGGGAENNAPGVRSVIGGGQGNNANEEYSSILGGQGNTASGQYSTVVGGQGNVATGVGSVAMGTGVGATGSRAVALGGGVGANGDYSVAMGGFGNALGNFSAIIGLNAYTNKHGQIAHGSGAFGTIGDAQSSELLARNTTSDASWTELFLDGNSANVSVMSNSAWTFIITVTGFSSSGNVGSYEIKGAIKNISGTTTIVGTPTVNTIAEDDSSWNVRVSADDSSDKLVIEAAGADATDIRWLATIKTTEVSY